MSQYERTDRILARASRGEANVAEIEECIAATRADLDHNLSAIERRLSTDELINQAVDYLRAGPNEFLSNFGQTVKANPVPVALLSVSLGWLMLAGRGPSSNGRAAHGHETYGGNDWAGESSYDDGGHRATEVSDTIRRVRESMGDQVGRVSARASRLGDQATDLGDRVSNKLGEAKDKISDIGRRGEHVFQSAKDSIARARSTLSQQPRRLREGYQDLAENHPFVLGAIAFAVGVAVAASLRRTQLEDGTMGELRDEVVDKAEGRARSELQRGMESVQTAFTNKDAEMEPDYEGEEGSAVTDDHSEQNYQDRVH